MSRDSYLRFERDQIQQGDGEFKSSGISKWLNSNMSFSLFLLSEILLHLYFAPFTKVEESFNMQAIHDFTIYGIPWNATSSRLSDYDHVEYPPPIPRTFTGAMLVSWLLKPLMLLASKPLYLQMSARMILGVFNWLSLCYVQHALAKSFGRSTGNWFILFQATGFHVPFYSSRVLPNMFAFPIVNVALAKTIYTGVGGQAPNSRNANAFLSLMLLTIAGAVFRGEIAIVVFLETAAFLYFDKIPLSYTVAAGGSGLLLSAVLACFPDWLVWNDGTLWPELSGFIYNVVNKQASNWGTSPFTWYFVRGLPSLLFNPLVMPLLIFTLSQDSLRRRTARLCGPALGFIFLYSFLPHKEARFIIYSVTPITAVAAVGASWIWTRRSKLLIYWLVSWTIVASVITCDIAAKGKLWISSLNYPGGEAMLHLYDVAANETRPLKVYVDNLACQTGVTRFLEDRQHALKTPDGRGRELLFNQTRDEVTLLTPNFWSGFDYAIVEYPERVIGPFVIVDVVEAFDGFTLVNSRHRTVDPHISERDKALLEQASRPSQLAISWNAVGHLLRVFTGGHWIGIRMRPMLKIMKKTDLRHAEPDTVSQ